MHRCVCMCVHFRIRDRAEERLAWLESEVCRRNVMAQVAGTRLLKFPALE
jgi:hypothetical protein